MRLLLHHNSFFSTTAEEQRGSVQPGEWAMPAS
jgi:hypothetical protein